MLTLNSESLWTMLEQLSGGNCVAQCSCGTIKVVRKYNIVNNLSLSCGCRSRSIVIREGIPEEYSKRLIRIFSAMKQRCYNENHESFSNYGGKGIEICTDWLENSLSFYLWSLANGYNNNLSIDRIDPNLGYFPDNCRWVTAGENTTRMLLDNFENKTGQFNEYSINKLTEINRDNLGKRLILVDSSGESKQFRCLLGAAEYIVKERTLTTSAIQIKKNLSACLHKKRKSCHGYQVLQVGDPYQEF